MKECIVDKLYFYTIKMTYKYKHKIRIQMTL